MASKKIIRIMSAAFIAAFGVWLAAACANPLSPPAPSGANDRSNGGSVFITAFNLNTKGDSGLHPSRKVNLGGTDIGFNSIGGTAMQRDIADGRDAMHPDTLDPNPSEVVIGGNDGYAALVPVISATPGVYVLPLTQRYIDYAFSDSSVRAAAYDWAVRLKTEAEGVGLTPEYILTLIEEQNKKTAQDMAAENPIGLHYFRAPIAGMEGKVTVKVGEEEREQLFAVDFSSAIDIVVLSAQGKDTRRYKVTMTPPTSTPLYVNAQTGNDNNTGLNWTDAFKTLERALKEPNRNSNLRLPKEIRLAGDINGGGKQIYYDLKGFIPAKGASPAILAADGIDATAENPEAEVAKLIPPEGGISIIGGFQGIETAQGENPNDPDRWPTFVYNSKPEIGAGSATASGGEKLDDVPATVSVYGVPFELEKVTLSAAKFDGPTLTIISDSGAIGPGGNLAVFVGKEVSGTPAQGSLLLNNRGYITGGDTTSYANSKGGGVYITDGGTLNLKGGAITLSKAKMGGGVYVDYGTVNITAGKIAGNTATESTGSISGGAFGGGGGMYIGALNTVKKAVVNFTAGEIIGNYAKAGFGGGVFVDAEGNSERRGSFFMGIGSASISAGTRPEISGNIAKQNGGGVFYIFGASESTSAIVKKAGDLEGQPSGIIRALDDGVPPLKNGVPEVDAQENPRCLSNIAMGGVADLPAYPIAVPGQTVWNQDNGHAIAKNGVPIPNGSNTLGSFINFDSNDTSSSGSAEGKISDFTVEYTSEGGRELNVAVSHPYLVGSDEEPGRITVWMPANAIDNYKDGAGIILADNTKTNIKSSSSSILLQIPDDILDVSAGSPLGVLFPQNKGVFANKCQTALSRIIPIKTTGRDGYSPAGVLAELKAALQELVLTEGATFNQNAAISKLSDASYRTAASASEITAGPANTTKPVPVNYGSAPLYLVIDSNKNIHVYYVDVKPETGSPLYVDADYGNDTKDGRSWQTAKKTIQKAIEAVPAYSPTEIWVQKGMSSAETLGPITGDKRITIIGGFNGGELTKAQRGTVTNNAVEFGFATGTPINAGAQVSVEYATIKTNPIILKSGSSLTLGEGVTVDGISIVAANSQVTLKDNALMKGAADKTGITMTGGSLTMSGTSQITGYGKGGVALSGASMIMNDSSKVLGNLITHATNPPVSGATPISAGVTLLNSSSLIMNDLPYTQEPAISSGEWSSTGTYSAGAVIALNGVQWYAEIATSAGDRPGIDEKWIRYYADPPQIQGNNMITDGSSAPWSNAPGGGGIYAKNSTITLEASTGSVVSGARIKGNTVAKGNGGGVYLDAGARLIFNKGEITNNSTSGSGVDGFCDGGGVYLSGPNDTGPGKFVNRSTVAGVTVIQAANQSYNNGVQLDMSGAADIDNLSLSAHRLKSAVIAGNSAAKRGGGVFLNPGAELYKFSGARDSVNKKGVIFGASFGADGSLINSAPAGAAIFDLNASWDTEDNYNHGLFLKKVERNVWGVGNGSGPDPATDTSEGTGIAAGADTDPPSKKQGNRGNYPPDLNHQTDGDASLDRSSYYQANAPSRNTRIAVFQLTKDGVDYTASINDSDSSTYKHYGELNNDVHAAASGVIKIRLPLSVVQANNGASFSVKIKPSAESNIAVGREYGAKVIMPLDTYHNQSHALSSIFPGAQTYDHTTNNLTSSPSAAITTEMAMETIKTLAISDQDFKPEGGLLESHIIKIQEQADNRERGLAYGTAAASSQYTTTGGTRAALYALKYGTADDGTLLPAGTALNPPASSWVPQFSFAQTAQINTYYLYCVSESGNVRVYKLVVDVYTAVPKYVNTTSTTGGPFWGQDRGTTLEAALASAVHATTSVDIWVKSNGATAWTDNTDRKFDGSPVTITGGFLGTEVTPEARPSLPGEEKTIYAHEDNTAYVKATYHLPTDASGPRDGTVKAYTKGPNVTKIKLGRTIVDEGTVLTFRDINVDFEGKNLIINGGQVVLENAWFTFTSGNIVIANGGLLKMQDLDHTAAWRESLIQFNGTGEIIVGTKQASGGSVPPYGTVSGDTDLWLPGQGKFDLYSGMVKSNDIPADGLIRIGDYKSGDLTSSMSTNGSRLQLSIVTPNNKADANAGAIKDVKNATAASGQNLVWVGEDATFTMNGGVIDGAGNIGVTGSLVTTGSGATGVLVAGSKAVPAIGANPARPAPKYGIFTMNGGSIKGFGGTTGTGVKLQVHAEFHKSASATIYGIADKNPNPTISNPNVFGNTLAIDDGTLEGAQIGLPVNNDLAEYDILTPGVNATNGKAKWNQTFGQGTTFDANPTAKFGYLYQKTPLGGERYILLAFDTSSGATAYKKAKFRSSTSNSDFKVFGQGLIGATGVQATTLLRDKGPDLNFIRVVLEVKNNTILSPTQINVVVGSSAIDTQEYLSGWENGSDPNVKPDLYAAFGGADVNALDGDGQYINVTATNATTFTTTVADLKKSLLLGQEDTRIGDGYSMTSTDIVLKVYGTAKLTAGQPIYLLMKSASGEPVTAGNKIEIGPRAVFERYAATGPTVTDDKFVYLPANTTASFGSAVTTPGNYKIVHKDTTLGVNTVTLIPTDKPALAIQLTAAVTSGQPIHILLHKDAAGMAELTTPHAYWSYKDITTGTSNTYTGIAYTLGATSAIWSGATNSINIGSTSGSPIFVECPDPTIRSLVSGTFSVDASDLTKAEKSGITAGALVDNTKLYIFIKKAGVVITNPAFTPPLNITFSGSP
jgi:hypothetical protein